MQFNVSVLAAVYSVPWRRMLAVVCVLVALGFAPVAPAANGKVTIKGVEGDLRANVSAQLTLEQEPCSAPAWRVQAGLEKADGEVRRALQAFGYYQPVIQRRLDLQQKNGCWSAEIAIQPGRRVVLRDIDIQIRGDARDDDSFVKLLDKPGLKSGQALRHDHYTALKSRIANLAAERGYFNSHFTRHELRVDPAAGVADVHVHFDSGPRFRFGESRVVQAIVKAKLLQRYFAFKAGQPYTRSALTDTSNALSSSGYFAQVLVQPMINEAQDQQVPIRITLTPAKRHRYSASVGYATDTGPRFGLGYRNQRVNRRGHQFSSDLSVSQVISKFTLAYSVPLKQPQTDKLKFEAGLKFEDNGSFRTDTSAVSVSRSRLLHNGWLQEQSLSFGKESFKIIGAPRESSLLLMPGIGWSRTFADNRLDPSRGLRLDVRSRGSLQQLVSDVSFLQLTGAAKGILALPWRLRVVGRVEGGVTLMDKFQALPPSVRFFAGGDNSIRGFAYKSLGPVNSRGEVEGGKNLLVGSLGLERRLTDKWGVALFVDSGNAFNGTDVSPRTGVGFGIRWRSPVGPLRLDFAHPLEKEGELVRLHFVMGPEL